MALATASTPPLPPDPLRLKRRLALQGAGFALLLLVAFSGSLYWGIAVWRVEDQRTELRQLAASAAAQLPLIAHETREPESRAKFQAERWVVALPALERQRLQWFDVNGSLLSEQGLLPLPPPPLSRTSPSIATNGPPRPIWQRWRDGMSLWQPVDSQVPGRDGTTAVRLGFVRVALSNQAALEDLRRLRRGLLLGGLVTAMAALLVGRRMLRAAFLPLQRQVNTLRRFTADASHELRHPLTALRALLAAVPPELRDAPDLAWRELDGLSRRMGELLEDLSLLARQEEAGLEGPLALEAGEAFDLLELLEDLIRCYAPQAAARSVTLSLTPNPEHHTIPIQGHSAQLLRLFTNLLLNAIRHSPEGGSVTVRVAKAGRLLRIAVADQGLGIPPQSQDRMFERFWSGADRGGHSGLGLAISRAIARRHGGELRLGDSRPGRCELLVELPAPSARWA